MNIDSNVRTPCRDICAICKQRGTLTVDLSLISQLYQKGYFSIHDGFADWKDAIAASVQPLVDAGAVSAPYADCIINNIVELGPYICIAPHICIPHAAAAEHVHETTLCFMKSNQPVAFGDAEEERAELFFVLAANDPDAHLENLEHLMAAIDHEDVIQALLEIKSEDDLKNLLIGY